CLCRCILLYLCLFFNVPPPSHLNPLPYTTLFRSDAEMLRDLAGELEWAKASLIVPDEYPAAVTRSGRATPEPPERVAEVYRVYRSEEHTSELQSRENLVCRLLLEKKNYLNA